MNQVTDTLGALRCFCLEDTIGHSWSCQFIHSWLLIAMPKDHYLKGIRDYMPLLVQNFQFFIEIQVFSHRNLFWQKTNLWRSWSFRFTEYPKPGKKCKIGNPDFFFQTYLSMQLEFTSAKSPRLWLNETRASNFLGHSQYPEYSFHSKLDQKSGNILWKGPESKYFRLCDHVVGLCLDYLVLLL